MRDHLSTLILLPREDSQIVCRYVHEEKITLPTSLIGTWKAASQTLPVLVGLVDSTQRFKGKVSTDSVRTGMAVLRHSLVGSTAGLSQ